MAAPDGVLVLRKERGPTSNAVLQRARRLLGGVKAGHAGTLDPAAEGVLLLCLGKATKIVPYLAGLEKVYVGRMRFGEETDTLDGEGRVVDRAGTGHLSAGLLREQMKALEGDIRQRPPMYSAVKVDGRRLYARARRGETVERPPRIVKVEEFSLLRWEPPEMEFRVRCGSGTYVRVLCHDLARRCGSAGHMTALTRTAVGPFRLEDAFSLDEVAAAAGTGRLRVVSAAEALAHLPAVSLDDDQVEAVRHGRLPPLPGGEGEGPGPGGPVRLIDSGGSLVAVVRLGAPDSPAAILRVI